MSSVLRVSRTSPQMALLGASPHWTGTCPGYCKICAPVGGSWAPCVSHLGLWDLSCLDDQTQLTHGWGSCAAPARTECHSVYCYQFNIFLVHKDIPYRVSCHISEKLRQVGTLVVSVPWTKRKSHCCFFFLFNIPNKLRFSTQTSSSGQLNCNFYCFPRFSELE